MLSHVSSHDTSNSKKHLLDNSANEISGIPDWKNVINTAANAIVSITFSQVSTFDMSLPGSSQATGFVVDSARGLVLTNRNVACAGPWIGKLVFYNHEEVDCRVIDCRV
jgi:S1-C subfamily serine protease